MATDSRFRWLCGIIFVSAVTVGATRSPAADPASAKDGSATPAATSSSGIVDMFDAMHDGDLGVQFIPRSSREATLILTNNTDQPLNVHLPEAFAAIPVVAQNPLGGRNPQQQAFGNPNPNGKQQNQTLGTGTDKQQKQAKIGFGGAVGNGQAGAGAKAANGAIAGAFNIPPERVVKLKLSTVCLEYGKTEPTARVPYTIVPIESYTSSGEVQELCRMLGTGTLDQQTAQAAAWHLENHITWDKLTDMKHFPHTGFTKPVFSKDQIHAAQELTDKVIKAVAAQPAAAPTHATTSTSSPPASKAVGLN